MTKKQYIQQDIMLAVTDTDTACQKHPTGCRKGLWKLRATWGSKKTVPSTYNRF
jgi:hypothetical protein